MKVGQRGRIEPMEIQRHGSTRGECESHRTHTGEVAQPGRAGKVGTAVAETLKVHAREARHARREGRAREVPPLVRRTDNAIPRHEAELHVFDFRTDTPRPPARTRPRVWKKPSAHPHRPRSSAPRTSGDCRCSGLSSRRLRRAHRRSRSLSCTTCDSSCVLPPWLSPAISSAFLFGRHRKAGHT